MAYAARHPEHVAHLMIVDSGAPRIQDTTFLFKNIYPETFAREDGLAFAVDLGDEKAIAADLLTFASVDANYPNVGQVPRRRTETSSHERSA